jgi:hypothetical protein
VQKVVGRFRTDLFEPPRQGFQSFPFGQLVERGQIAKERAELPPDDEKLSGVRDNRFNLPPVLDDAFIGQHLLRARLGQSHQLEAEKALSVSRPVLPD